MRVKEGENTMGNYTREEVLQMAEDEDVEFIRLQFTDMFGTLKNIAIILHTKTSHMKADANVFLERNTIKNIKMQNRQANM